MFSHPRQVQHTEEMALRRRVADRSPPLRPSRLRWLWAALTGAWLVLAGAGCLSNPTPHPWQPDAGRLDDGPDSSPPTKTDPDLDNGYSGGRTDVVTEVPGPMDGTADVVGDGVDPTATLGDAIDGTDPDALSGDGVGDGGQTGTNEANDDDDDDDDDGASPSEPDDDFSGRGTVRPPIKKR